jgi:hypothetical protein
MALSGEFCSDRMSAQGFTQMLPFLTVHSRFHRVQCHVSGSQESFDRFAILRVVGDAYTYG